MDWSTVICCRMGDLLFRDEIVWGDIALPWRRTPAEGTWPAAADVRLSQLTASGRRRWPLMLPPYGRVGVSDLALAASRRLRHKASASALACATSSGVSVQGVQPMRSTSTQAPISVPGSLGGASGNGM